MILCDGWNTSYGGDRPNEVGSRIIIVACEHDVGYALNQCMNLIVDPPGFLRRTLIRPPCLGTECALGFTAKNPQELDRFGSGHQARTLSPFVSLSFSFKIHG